MNVTTTIPHYLRADVRYLPKSDVGTRRPASMGTSGEPAKLAETLASMEAQDYVILGVEVYAYCEACNGAGSRPAKRRRTLYATVPCKACKGHKDALFTVPYSYTGEVPANV